MIKIEKREVVGWEAAIRGMRNPKNSWDNSDSLIHEECTIIGEKDLNLMQKLSDAGTDHGKFMRMIAVYADITAPLYWWKEYDTYKVGTVANSCSTMHKIQSKEFTLDDFSTEHLNEWSISTLLRLIGVLEASRKMFNENGNKDDWWQMIQMLPTSYNQKRTVMMNYAVLKNIYNARKNHKLDEWHGFCEWIEELPYSELITGGAK